MAEPISTFKVGFEVANLSWEAFKAARNFIQALGKHPGHKALSSLTTLEFTLEGNKQIAHYVQDRTFVFTQNNQACPPFLHWTQGTHSIDEVNIDGIKKRYKVKEVPAGAKYILVDDDKVYSAGDRCRAVLIARSINGFNGEHEGFDIRMSEWYEALTFAIVFPPERIPKGPPELLYQSRKESEKGVAGHWKPARRESHDFRRTTRERMMFVWETRHPRLGDSYSVRWTWEPWPARG